MQNPRTPGLVSLCPCHLKPSLIKPPFPIFRVFFSLLTVRIFLFSDAFLIVCIFRFFGCIFAIFLYFPIFRVFPFFSPADLPHVRFLFWLHFAVFPVFCSMPGVDPHLPRMLWIGYEEDWDDRLCQGWLWVQPTLVDRFLSQLADADSDQAVHSWP